MVSYIQNDTHSEAYLYYILKKMQQDFGLQIATKN